MGLFAGTEGQDREHQHGYPLGRGQPDEVPQAFREAFHSAQEEQFDSAPEYMVKDSDEESNDIVMYDTEMSSFTTVANQE